MEARVNQDQFSNGEEHRWWTARNCDKCIKSPKMVFSDLFTYRECRCAIYRDIDKRMFSDDPIAQRTIDVCKMKDCPFRKEHWPQHKHRSKTAGLPSLFERRLI